jgi:hypothetical protein
MRIRNRTDVEINIKVFEHVRDEFISLKEKKPQIQTYIRAEHYATEWATRCKVEGWPFDREKAVALEKTLFGKLEEARLNLEAKLGTKTVAVDKCKGVVEEKVPRWTKFGAYDHHTAKYFDVHPFTGLEGEERMIEGPYCRVEFKPLNLASSDDVKLFLFRHGWQPTEYNYKMDPETRERIKTSPKITEDSLEFLGGDGKLYIEYLTNASRYGILKTWLENLDASYLDVAITAANDVISNSGVELSNSNGLFNETDLYNPEILWGYYREKENTYVSSFEELMRTYPNVSTDNVINSQSPVALKQANGQTFEGWAIYFPTQDLVDQFLVTDEETGKAMPWYETSQYKNNVTVLDPSSITEAGQVDAYKQVNGDARRIPTPQDLKQLNKSYPTFTRYHQLNKGADRDLSELMYSGRDRRFYTAIVYDKCSWIGETVELNLGGNLSAGVRDKEDGGWYNTTTGYYWRKGNIENPTPRAYHNCQVALHFNIVRLGEAYMNLAEAYLLKHDVPNAVKALNMTRTIHGGLSESTAATEEEAWTDYIRERNCELTNEGGDIYYSYLRWGKYGGYANHGRDAGDIIYDLDRPVYKMSISRDRSKLLVGQMTLNNSAQRKFTEKRYLLPINQSFLNTREAYGLDHVQNKGW